MRIAHKGRWSVALVATTVVALALACTKQNESQPSRPATSGPSAAASTPGVSLSLPAAPVSRSSPGETVDRIDYQGWSLQVVSAKTRQEPLWINDPTFSLGHAKPAAPAGRKVKPKGLLWLVTVKAVHHGGEDIWARSVAVIDETGRSASALGGGPGDGSFFMKGMGINESGTYVLVFDVPADARNPKLQLMKGSPTIALPQPGQ